MEDSHQSQSLSTEHGDRSTVPDANSGAGIGSSSAKYKLFSPAKLPISRSPCITIPPGFSPTAFLESPVLLSNMKAEPSPTTGSFWNAQVMNSGGGGASGFSFSVNCSNSNRDDGRQTDFFEFRPHTGAGSVAPMISTGLNNPKSQSSEQAQVLSFPSRATILAGVDSDELNQGAAASNGVQRPQPDSKDNLFPASNERSTDDGYNWRKYGQKLVKGSEFPRSYYKCTHPNCEVKKIFERSPEGQMTEIVYKGTHDHPKPQPARRYNPGAIMSSQANATLLLASQEDKSAGLGQICSNIDPNGTCELSPLEANDDSADCVPSPLNGTNDEEDDDDDQLAKRRKLDGTSLDVVPIVKPIREPRVVVQTVSEVDILDDGYRWRKYGQKVVRGNPNPRSYYKCTSVGCPVRKHVERASHDPRAVITTYEGKHDHDLPVAKNAAANDTSGPANGNGMSRVGHERSSSGSVSLDLGVGIRSNESQQILDSQPLHNTNPNFRVVQLTPTHYGAYSFNPCPQTFLEEYS